MTGWENGITGACLPFKTKLKGYLLHMPFKLLLFKAIHSALAYVVILFCQFSVPCLPSLFVLSSRILILCHSSDQIPACSIFVLQYCVILILALFSLCPLVYVVTFVCPAQALQSIKLQFMYHFHREAFLIPDNFLLPQQSTYCATLKLLVETLVSPRKNVSAPLLQTFQTI